MELQDWEESGILQRIRESHYGYQFPRFYHLGTRLTRTGDGMAATLKVSYISAMKLEKNQ